MKAMVLAAGMGTRLRPLTNDRPKALVEVGGRTMLEITLERLRSFGIREVVVNAHHHSEMIVDYLAENDFFGLSIEVSLENELLDTGGGLKKAAPMLLAGHREPILIHNVDVLSSINFNAMLTWHKASNALATLAVKPRASKRQLLFDAQDLLCGRQHADGSITWARKQSEAAPLAFCGVHLIEPRLLEELSEQGPFSIIPAYLRLAAAGEAIQAYRADRDYWRDLGKPESVLAAEADIASGKYS
jgi:NDP-sugar pyrophosphorylase family protein